MHHKMPVSCTVRPDHWTQREGKSLETLKGEILLPWQHELSWEEAGRRQQTGLMGSFARLQKRESRAQVCVACGK